VKSATAGGRDVLDTPLEIRPDSGISDVVVTFTDRVSELSGRISDKLDRPASEFYVVAFSIDPTRWRQRSRWLDAPRRPTAEGRYSFTGLPPGQYYLAVLPEYEQTIWYTPEYLEQVVPGAIKVTIGEGEKKTQDVRLGV
jgi:hypothetical protein